MARWRRPALVLLLAVAACQEPTLRPCDARGACLPGFCCQSDELCHPLAADQPRCVSVRPGDATDGASPPVDRDAAPDRGRAAVEPPVDVAARLDRWVADRPATEGPGPDARAPGSDVGDVDGSDGGAAPPDGRGDAASGGVAAALAAVCAGRAGGLDSDVGRAIAAATDGALYVGGHHGVGEVVFGPGEAGETIVVGRDDHDAFVARFRPDCALDWVHAAASDGTEDDCAGLAAAPDGGVFAAGYVGGPAALAGEPLGSCGDSDPWLARLADDGRVLWVRQACGPGRDRPYSLTAFADGGVGLAGPFATRLDFGGGRVLTGSGEDNLFVARYDGDGQILWARKVAVSGTSAGAFLAAAGDGSVRVAGHFSGGATFGPGEPAEQRRTAIGLDPFVARYEADGRLAWVQTPSGAGTDVAYSAAVAEDGTAVITGRFAEALDLDGAGGRAPVRCGGEGGGGGAGEEEAFVAAFADDGAGTPLWIRIACGVGAERGKAVAILPGGRIAWSGHVGGEARFFHGEPDQLQVAPIDRDDLDVFLAILDLVDGTPRLLRVDGGPGNDEPTDGEIAVLPDGSVALTGLFHRTATFGAGACGAGAACLTAAGDNDVFVVRYAPPDPP